VESLAAGPAFGAYEIQKLLGAGGMGEVYLAQDRRLKRPVALKVLPPDFAASPERLARFEREATAAASLNHPNICTIYEVGEVEGRPFLAMEYVEGVTLRERLSAQPLSIEEALEIGIQIADALDQARKRDLVHRDIKSANIMLAARNHVKVLDFGLAKQVRAQPPAAEAPTATGLTQEGVVIGTVAYMSPEQALGRAVDHRSDIFSFGVVLYEMLTGRLPFAGPSTQEQLVSVLHHDPPPIARFNDKVPEALVRVVGKMLAKDREERYQSAHEIWTDLRHLKAESGERRIPQPTTLSRRRWMWPALAAGVLAAAAVAGVLLWRKLWSPGLEAASIVALPAQVYGADELKYLTDAIPSTLSTQLANVEGLETKAPPNSVDVERVGGDLRKIADVYGVKLCVSSSVTADGERLNLNVRLVEAKTRRVLWSEEYSGSRAGYLSLIHRSAEGIRGALKPASSPIAPASASSEAELAFRQGEHYRTRRGRQNAELALSSFQRALQLDPKMANAAAMIAGLYLERDPAQAEAWARKALAIDPRCARAWAAMSTAEGPRPQASRRKILDYSLRAGYFGPGDAVISGGLVEGMFHGLGAVTLALDAAHEAARIDPLVLSPQFTIPLNLCNLGRPAEALASLERALSVDPSWRGGAVLKVRSLADLGRLPEATELLQQLRLSPEGRFLGAPTLDQASYWLAVARGDRLQESALRARFWGWIQDPKTSGDYHDHLSIDLAALLARQRLARESLDVLERSIELGVLIPYDWLVLNPDLASIRPDARFQKIANISRAHFTDMLTVVHEARARAEFPKYLEKPLADLLAKLEVP
jgi:TolB-like protein